METWDFVGWQYGMTAILVLAALVFLLMRVRRSQRKRGEDPGEVVAEPSAQANERRR
jgi:predicted MFS family arabinose efflux permease